jgi:hypothetical protein
MNGQDRLVPRGRESAVGDRAERRTLQDPGCLNELVPTLRGAVRERAAAEGEEVAEQKLAMSKIHGGVALAAEREAVDADEEAEDTFVSSGNRRASRRMTRFLMKRMAMKRGWRTLCRMFGAGK